MNNSVSIVKRLWVGFLQLVCNWCAVGCNWCAIGVQFLCNWYAVGVQLVFNWCAIGVQFPGTEIFIFFPTTFTPAEGPSQLLI